MRLRLLTGVAFLFFLPGHTMSFLQGLGQLADYSGLWGPLAAGFVLGSILWKFVLSKIPGFETFEHELTHALVALLFFRRVTQFHVTRHHGGFVRHLGWFGGGFGNDMIGLAPYFLPTITMALALFAPWVPDSWKVVFVFFIGITLAYHTFSTIDETIENWSTEKVVFGKNNLSGHTDIGRRGYLFSAIVIASATLALHGLIWVLLVSGYGGVGEWFRENIEISISFWALLVSWLNGFVSKLMG